MVGLNGGGGGSHGAKKSIERGREPHSPRPLLFSAPLFYFIIIIFLAASLDTLLALLILSSLMCTVNTIVFSKLFHCYSVWAGTSKGNITRLLLVENFAVRILSVERI